MKDGIFYCQEDYQQSFVAKCKVCSQELVGEIVTVLNFSFHRDCFRCTRCCVMFHPGDRVTVWHEQFFCPPCMLCVSPGGGGESTNGLTNSTDSNMLASPRVITNGAPKSSPSLTDDEGCISAAEAMLSDAAALSPCGAVPTQSGDSPLGNGGAPSVSASTRNGLETTVEEFRLPSSGAKCLPSGGQPQKSKSILRKSGTEATRSREHVYLSTDSGLGDRVYESKQMENHSNALGTPRERVNNETTAVVDRFSQSDHSPNTLSMHQSRQSLSSSRVPNSDYGRHLNQSYIHINGSQTSRPSDITMATDKRNVSFTTLNNFTKPRHFHIPEAKHRFLPPDTSISSLLFGQSEMSTMRPSPVHASTPRSDALDLTPRRVQKTKPIARSALELSPRSPISNQHHQHHIDDQPRDKLDTGRGGAPSIDALNSEEQRETLEARRLACYPSGHERDKEAPAPIERYDWPGPPASAVVLAELMRERRCRRREQARLSGTLGDDADDFESQEALSIDYSYDGALSTNDVPVSRQTSGIGKAILREEAAAVADQKRRSQSHQYLDPVSASRSPNAAIAPGYKPRYATHQFACNPIRPGYTGGRLSENDKTASLPASTLLLSSSTRPSYHHHSVHMLASNTLPNGNGGPLRQNGTSHLRLATNGYSDSTDKLLAQMGGDIRNLGYPHVHYAPPPSAAFYKSEPVPPKVIPYDELKAFRGKTPKGIDRTALEMHLSDDQFDQVFHLSRTAYYRLPEWKRNDLKRRAELF